MGLFDDRSEEYRKDGSFFMRIVCGIIALAYWISQAIGHK